MKKNIKQIAIFCLTLIVFSCQNPYSVFDESTKAGIYPYIKGTPQSVLFYFNQGASSYKADMALSGAEKVDKMNTYVVVGGAETLVKSFPLPATSTYEVTLQEVATALNQPLSSFTPGAQVTLRNKIVATDGTVWDAKTSSHLAGGLLGGTAYQNLFADLSVFVTCPFVADEAAGTYTVVQDDWEDVFPGDQVTVTKIDATHIKINEYPVTSVEQHPLVITVNPTSGEATVEKQYSGKYNTSSGPAPTNTTGSGFVFSCAGYIKVTLNFTVNGGAYNGYTLIISK